MQREPAREGHDTTQGFVAAQGRIQGQGTTLRESANDDAVRGDSLVNFIINHFVHQVGRLLDAILILGTIGVQRTEVKPINFLVKPAINYFAFYKFKGD
jgi:hypothetical protein